MRIRVVMVGKVKEKYMTAGIAEYIKRLGPYARTELITLADEAAPDGASTAEEEQTRAREGQRILKVLADDQFVVALDSRGEMLSSEDLAAFLAERALRGQPQVSFVIGGSLGLSSAVLRRADLSLSLGKMTFLHQMVPLIMLEQIYRGFKINRGEPYHK